MLHTFNVLLLAERAGVRRVVLASSNHVMGGYKEKRSHGLVRPADPPACGTPLRDPVLAASGDAVACFLFSRGEQLCKSLAATRRGLLPGPSYYMLRIGWCQPGENLPATLSAAGANHRSRLSDSVKIPEAEYGVGGEAAAAEAEDVDGDWFTGMWLSNRDFLSYFEAALRAPAPSAGEAAVLVNAMSNNTGMRWSLEETVAALGVAAQDDARRP
ncbi:hypothetical protein EMIHUDRAFT_252003 [Emiliania huxleyi CCMP1516]|uniref:NAD-dependent epimerase/dehydratase domain-containing protein n=2 Tax=Emiliania huxleyi TaxID=2903 RepID=A0A0D3KPN4_EMIH1|nr:hypothetical protein EMIHUDRAFT_252003 [Emiliania huxleyi CCMP1516]EOD37719.1 hypothetical protein EMIHUDRAFT_252003 [Emiliania huxleyi CCMP1516]|eukprot:XP_005790148.1 hypothetical protein EMIHUDRAFT_252003 [Emiliania huxleyi CCMP1516]